MRKRDVGVLTVIALFVILSSNVGALAESLWWTPATTNSDGSYTFTPSEMATMTYYVRIDKPNPRDLTGTSGWYYLGETRGGVSSFPADNSLASLMRSYGFSGQPVKFTVSQSFKDTDGVERDSAQSTPYPWVVPVIPPPVVLPPKAPSGCFVK